jgi:hypothetical protein
MKFITDIIVGTIVTVAFLALVGYGLLQWAEGCGEHYTDSKGVTHTIQCN